MYARYTEYLRDLMLNEHTKAALNKALSTYPLYTPEEGKVFDLVPTRDELNTKLLNHYKYREIGFETVGRFLDELEITMCEIMPRYNELFKTVVTMAELPSPFDNVDFTETYEEERTGTSTSEGNTTSKQTGSGSQSGTSSAQNTGTSSEESSGTNKTTGSESGTTTNEQTNNSKRILSDTPQDSLGIGTKSIDSVNYGSEAEWKEDITDGSTSNTSSSTNNSETDTNTERSTSETSTGTSSSESTTSTDEEGTSNVNTQSTGKVTHSFHKIGNQGVNTYAHDMNEFRTSIIDVVDQIINDTRIGQLFRMVY